MIVLLCLHIENVTSVENDLVISLLYAYKDTAIRGHLKPAIKCM